MSTANYIIICDGRTQALIAANNVPCDLADPVAALNATMVRLALRSSYGQLRAASACAASVVNNLSIRFPAKVRALHSGESQGLLRPDVLALSDLLHKAMAGVVPRSWSHDQKLAFFGSEEDIPEPRDLLSAAEAESLACNIFAQCDKLSEKFEGSE